MSPGVARHQHSETHCTVQPRRMHSCSEPSQVIRASSNLEYRLFKKEIRRLSVMGDRQKKSWKKRTLRELLCVWSGSRHSQSPDQLDPDLVRNPIVLVPIPRVTSLPVT
ncbi:hypothetical protein RRG08_032540 [Elysia crispata]|uniref:Uncharacterized protein n=1 Tax=Elysia crispata TaxID=231223 RepID=A0AAE1DP20_9GAST|nr:hypothetical protein RRG08_032540 [Elysia crispata]